MAEYPGVPRTAFRFTSRYVTFGVLEWGLEFLACLPVFVALLLFLPDGVGFFLVALTGAAVTRAGDVLNSPVRDSGRSELVDVAAADVADRDQLEVLAFVVGLYVGVSAFYGTPLVLASVGGWAIGVVAGHPSAALVFAVLVPYLDHLLLARTGVSVGRLGGAVTGGLAVAVLGAYGLSVAPIRRVLRQGRPIR